MEPSKIAQNILLAILLFITISSVFCETLAEPPANFTEADAGTADNPYQIATLANLRWLSETQEVWGGISLTTNSSYTYVDYGTLKYFIQIADIDASETISWNNGLGFSPIGSQYIMTNFTDEQQYTTIFTMNPFQGFFNGNNHVIYGLYIYNHINYNEYQYWQLDGVGLFGLIWYSTIANVRLINANINMPVTFFNSLDPEYLPYVGNRGMLVSNVNQSSILNCSATGIMNNSCGLIGTIKYNSLVEYCSSITYGNIIDGQLIGHIWNSRVRNSFARGCTQYNAGYYQGLIGSTTYNAYIHNVYIGSLNGVTNVNWLVYNLFYSGVFNSRFEEETSNAPNAELGFPSPPAVTSFVNDCYNLLTEQMKDSTYYWGWDFENIWDIDPSTNDGYPFLRNETIAEHLSNNSDITKPLSTTLLFENYPNPFNPETTIRFSVAKDNYVSLEIYNIKGQLVCSLVDSFYKGGTHNALWNGKDNHGNIVSSGVYFCRLNVGEYSAVKKMLLLK